MSTEHPEDLLAAYVDDELGAADRVRVEDHLATCARCREEVGLSRRAHRALAGLEPVAAPLGIGTPAIEAARRDRGGWAHRLRWAIPAAAAAALIAVFAVVATRGSDPLGAGAGSGEAATEDAGDAPVPTPGQDDFAPLFFQTDADYSADDLQAIVRATGRGEETAAGARTTGELSQQAVRVAASCVERAGLRVEEGTQLLRIELARYDGEPAYVVLFSREDAAEIWAVDRESCEIRYVATSRG